MKKILTFLALIVGLQFGTSAQTLPQGCQAPDFTLTDLNGNPHTLSTYLNAGKTVVIWWFGSNCVPNWDYHQTNALNEFYQLHGPNGTSSQDVVVLAIEIENWTDDACISHPNCGLGDFVTNALYPVINEPGTDVWLGSYGVTARGQSTIICPDGEILTSFYMPDSNNDFYNYIIKRCDCAEQESGPRISISPTQMDLQLESTIGNEGVSHYQVQYRTFAQTAFTTKTSSTPHVRLTLEPNTYYLMRTRAKCDGVWQPYKNIGAELLYFGDCSDSGISPSVIPSTRKANSATIHWQHTQGATRYQVRIRKLGYDYTLGIQTYGPWINKGSSTTGNRTITGLDPASKYQVQVRRQCNGAWQPYPDVNFVYGLFETLCDDPAAPLTNASENRGELEDDQVLGRLWPNPVSEVFYLDFEEKTIRALSILDAQGRQVFNQENPTEGAGIRVSTLEKGIYFVKILTEQGEIFTEKMLKI